MVCLLLCCASAKLQPATLPTPTNLRIAIATPEQLEGIDLPCLPHQNQHPPTSTSASAVVYAREFDDQSDSDFVLILS